MSYLVLGLAVLVCISIMFTSLYLSGALSTRAKKEMKCIVFNSQDAFLEKQSDLRKAGVHFSHMLWSPMQMAYNIAGAAQKSPKEIWVAKEDWEKAKEIVQTAYFTEIDGNRILVRERKT